MSALSYRPAHSHSDLAKGAFPLLLIVGTLLSIAVLLSKIAASHNAAMLSYLTLAMGGSGIALTAANLKQWRGQGAAGVIRLLPYSFAAGALMALGSALGYLTIHKVGAAFITLALAFPPMLTWLLSFALRMEKLDGWRLAGLLASVAGGVILAFGKGLGAAQSDTGAILLACCMPVVLAIGNVFRSRYWPHGATPRQLAGLMLICGAIVTSPFALWHEGTAGLAIVNQTPLALITLAAIVAFVAQYAAFFKLQQISGPVYISQIGSVAAIVGSPIAVAVLGEHLPQGFVPATLFIVIGVVAFQYRTVRGK